MITILHHLRSRGILSSDTLLALVRPRRCLYSSSTTPSQWDTAALFPFVAANTRVFVVGVSCLDTCSTARVASALETLQPHFALLETDKTSLSSECHKKENIDPFLAHEKTQNNWLHFAFDAKDNSALIATIKQAHSLNAKVKALDLPLRSLLYPDPFLQSHLTSLTTHFQLPQTPEKVRTTRLSNFLYRSLTSPPFLPRPGTDAFESSLATYKSHMKSWATFHPKHRFYLSERRDAFAVGQIAALTRAWTAQHGPQEELRVVVVVAKARVFGMMDLWRRFVGEVEGMQPEPAVSGRKKGVHAFEYFSDEEPYDVLGADDFELATQRGLMDEQERQSLQRASRLLQSKPGVTVIQGSRG
ncbi:hypothetical protein HDU98_008258 [Podochytrium sp. JEL0797]|nr:hypothetical protein HDU98_008258 [Podochytrium sp. JEL0797]